MSKGRKILARLYLWIVLAVLYAPIIFIAVFVIAFILGRA